MKKYRIVIDTNVIVSAARSRKGASFKLISTLRENQFTFLLSTPLVLEYEMVLKRDKIQKAFTFSEIEELIDIICLLGENQRVWYLWRPLLGDANDDFIAELAINAQADFIVTYNKKDFEPIRSFGVKLVSPKEFLDLLDQKV